MDLKRDSEVKRVLNATKQVDGLEPIDFSKGQRSTYAKTGSTASSNGTIPAVGKNKVTGYFRNR